MSIHSARKQWPGKFVFSFAAAGPKRGGPAIEYEGVLEVTDQKELFAVANEFLKWIEQKKPELEQPVPPAGMVGIQKTEAE